MACIVCKGDHYNDQCDRYKNLLDRKQKLSSEGRCFTCLKPGHVVKSCPISHKMACDHCGKKGYDNCCLCPDKCPEGANMFFVSEHNKVSEVTDNLTPIENRVHVESEQRVSANVTHSLLVSNERVLLQTAIVPIQTFDKQTTIKALVLLDSASQRTFITTKLAQKLKLQLEHKEYLSVSTFRAKRAKGVDTYVVTFKVKVNDGSFMTLSANVLQQITGYIQRGPLLQKDLEFLRLIPQDQLADSTPSAIETTTVDVLISSNFFWDIVGGDKVVLPSGMFSLSSKFGYIVTGKCPGGDNEMQVNTKFVGQILPGLTSYCLSRIFEPVDDLWSLEAIGIKDPMTESESFLKLLDLRVEGIKLHGHGKRSIYAYQITIPLL